MKLRPYFLGKDGLYKGDTANPYLNQLPTDAQIDTILTGGSAADCRILIINVVRSKVNCKDIGGWLAKVL